MNAQLIFQMLVHEAQSAGINLEKAKQVKFEAPYRTLTVQTEKRSYIIRLLSVEEKIAKQKQYPILSGPDAVSVTAHTYEMWRKERESLTFMCPSFFSHNTRRVKTVREFIDVRFDSVRMLSNYRMRFEGEAFVAVGVRPALGFPCGFPYAGINVYGEYNTETATGWMSQDMYSDVNIFN